MTQTPFVDEEELKRIEEENAAEEAAAFTPQSTPQTMYKEATPEENKKAGNVQPVKSPKQQGIQQLTGNKGQTPPDPNKPLNPGSGFIYGSGLPDASLMEDLGDYAGRTLEGLGAAGMGLIDFGMDIVGRIPGGERIDDAWDAKTKFKNPLFQKVRNAASIVIPSIAVGAATGGASVAAGGGAAIAKGAAVLGLNVAADIGINAVSDQSEGDTLSTFVKEAMPWAPVNEDWVVKDGDSPEVRRAKNMYESAGLSIVGDILGFAAAGAKPIMGWFQPKDEVARTFKANEMMVNMDAATATKISELQTQRAALDAEGMRAAQVTTVNGPEFLEQRVLVEGLSKASKKLQDDSVELAAEYFSTGRSRLTENPLDAYIDRMQTSRELQIDEVGKSRLFNDMEGAGGVDPFITPGMFPEGSSASLSITPGAVARNAADVTAIKLGGLSGSPAPILSERAYYDLAEGNLKARDIIVDLAESQRAAGDFDAIVDGFRYTKSDMSDAAFKVYADIMNAGDVGEIRKLFMADKDVKTLLDGRKIKYLNEVQAEAVGMAMRDLTKRYIGQEVTEQSARVMDTLGREISDIAEGYKALPEVADADRVSDMIGDRLAFLMEEYGLNKYIAGWSLKMKDRWKMMVQKGADKEATIADIVKQFDLKRADISNQAKGYKEMIKTITKEQPLAAEALIDAFALSKGNVDTLDKLMKFAAREMSPMGLLREGDTGGLNAFAQGAWAIRYSNVLSGLSAGRAIVGNGVNLILRPINSILGTGIGAAIGRNSIDDVKKAVYSNAAVFNTTKLALSDTFQSFSDLSKAGKWGDDLHLRPQMLARDDLVTGDTSAIEILDKMVPVWEKQGNIGRIMQYRSVKLMHQLGNWNMLKYGTNALQSADVFVRTTVAAQLARSRAYDEVMSIGFKGEELANQLAKAEKLAYSEMFTSTGEIADDVLRYASGEIALQLDDATANFVNIATGKLPILKPLFMFPKTGMNGVKLAMSYTPLATIPGMSRYGKVLSAGDDITKIRAALAEHGMNFDELPNGMAVFKGLEAEYTGRVAFGSLLAAGLFNHALSGNIRGNGPPNESERKKLRDNFNWQPKTINVGGKWVSYAGYEPLDTILSLTGDLAYYATDIGSTLTEDFMTKLGWSFSATFANKTWTQGLDPLLAILDGDETRITRHLANEARSAIPWSGALGVLANYGSSTQKDIYNDLTGYIKNRLPKLNETLPEQIDIFTGKPVNDIDNPVLRALNAVNPVKVSEGTEPWRQWLINTGWDGLQMIRKDSSGNHEYSPAERETLYRYIGEAQLWKQFDKLSRNAKYNDQLDRIRAMRVQGRPKDEIDAAQSEAYKVMDNIMRNAQKDAEQRLQAENEPMWRSIQESIRNKNYMQQGRIDDAARAADRRKAEIQRLTQMYK